MSTPHDVHFDDTLAATRGRSNYYFSFATWPIGVGSPRFTLISITTTLALKCNDERQCYVWVGIKRKATTAVQRDAQVNDLSREGSRVVGKTKRGWNRICAFVERYLGSRTLAEKDCASLFCILTD